MSRRYAVLFPGQGSQSVGMLTGFAGEPLVRATFDEASTGADVDLWQLASAGPAERLDVTEFTQPTLLAASVSIWRLWAARDLPPPDFLAGHSLGEWSALVAGSALSLVDAARLTRLRGQAMQAAVPVGSGAMAAVLGADDAQLASICEAASGSDGEVAPANFNSPGQTVIAGAAGAVDRAIAALEAVGGIRVVRLAVSVPSHTSLMAPAARQLEQALQLVELKAPKIPVIHNVDARSHVDPDAIRAALVAQLTSPVRWTACIEAMMAAGVEAFVEVGPGKVLTGLGKRIDRSRPTFATSDPAAFNTAAAAFAIS